MVEAVQLVVWVAELWPPELEPATERDDLARKFAALQELADCSAVVGSRRRETTATRSYRAW